MTTEASTFACPGCATPLVAGTNRCEHCRIRLVGELAMQLWRVDQQLAALRGQREWLVTALRRDDAPDGVPTFTSPSAPGTETRRVLLGLGAVCLIAALTAGTALIWPALGVGGQTTVLLLVTAALLAGAVRLQHRLPATADAIAAVGVAAAGVDLVAGRRLVAPHLGGAASHLYWFVGATLVCAVLGYVGSRARHLHSPTVGAVLASYGVVVALVSPTTVDGVALVGLIGSALSAAILRGGSRLPLMRRSARTAALVCGVAFVVLGALASLAAADGRGLGLWCGLALSVGVASVDERWGAATGGVLAGALLLRADVVPFGTWSVVTAGVTAAVLMLASAVHVSSSRAMRAAAFVGSAAALTQVAAQRSLQRDAIAGAHLIDAAIGLGIVAVVCLLRTLLAHRVEAASAAAVGATLAIAGAVAEAFGTDGLQSAADATAVITSGLFVVAVTALILAASVRTVSIAAAVSTCTGAIAAVAVDISLALRHASTVEVYVVAPAVVTTALGVMAMRRMPALSSWALLPAVFVTTTPTLLLALHGDLTRQIVVLVAAAAIVAFGAQGRLVCPLVSGAVEVVLVIARIAGPSIQQLPRWLTLGVLGAALIGLGSTWERRLHDVRRVAERLRPAVAALR